MAITKRIRVSFDLKMVVSSKELALVKAAIESGPESALEIAVKKTIKEELVDAFGDDQLGVSNLRFEVKQ